MADRLATASSWLAGKLGNQVFQSVTVTRNGAAIGASVKATYGRSQFEQDSEAGVIRWESKDFIIDSDAYTLSSVAVEPENGDRITDHLGNVFEVLGDNGLPCFKYTDPYRNQLRIHTKQVSA